MTNTRIDVLVKTCEQCPFYQRGVMSAIADALAKDDRKTGVCEYNARTARTGGFKAPLGHLVMFGGHIANPAQPPPPQCPLRIGDTVVRLAL